MEWGLVLYLDDIMSGMVDIIALWTLEVVLKHNITVYTLTLKLIHYEHRFKTWHNLKSYTYVLTLPGREGLEGSLLVNSIHCNVSSNPILLVMSLNNCQLSVCIIILFQVINMFVNSTSLEGGRGWRKYSLTLTLHPPRVGTPCMWHCKASFMLDPYCPGVTIHGKVPDLISASICKHWVAQ